MYQMTIIQLLVLIFNFSQIQNHEASTCISSIEFVDTINFWHILINDKVVLEANHNLEYSELEIQLDSKKYPNEILFDYRTDVGFEYSVDRIIEIQDSQNNILKRIEDSTYNYGERTKILIGEDLNKNEDLIIKCKFYISEGRIKDEKTYRNKRIIEKYRDKEKVDFFVICKLKISK